MKKYFRQISFCKLFSVTLTGEIQFNSKRSNSQNSTLLCTCKRATAWMVTGSEPVNRPVGLEPSWSEISAREPSYFNAFCSKPISGDGMNHHSQGPSEDFAKFSNQIFLELELNVYDKKWIIRDGLSSGGSHFSSFVHPQL